ncbi:hypothetical protein BJY52DRAFT_1243517 [Lactarius psammicola]|nr:hypothetical protein BJY52DRAFT_1243517 [Lactarius psammicola]
MVLVLPYHLLSHLPHSCLAWATIAFICLIIRHLSFRQNFTAEGRKSYFGTALAPHLLQPSLWHRQQSFSFAISSATSLGSSHVICSLSTVYFWNWPSCLNWAAC